MCVCVYVYLCVYVCLSSANVLHRKSHFLECSGPGFDPRRGGSKPIPHHNEFVYSHWSVAVFLVLKSTTAVLLTVLTIRQLSKSAIEV